MFYQETLRTLKQSNHAAESAQRAARGEIGTLTLGFCSVATAGFLPSIVRRYKELLPGVRLLFREMNPTQQEAAFSQGEIDVGITRPPFAKKLTRELDVKTILREPLLVAVPESHPVTARKMKVENLSEEPFILFHRDGAPTVCRILYVLAGGLAHEQQDISSINPVLGGGVQGATHTNPDRRFASVSDLRLSFEAAMGILLGTVEEGSIDRIIEEITNNSNNWTIDVPRLQRAIAGHEEDGDLVHKVLMKIPPPTFQHFEYTALVHLRALVATFARYTVDQSWSFSYTDQIGSHCAQLFRVSKDPSIRVALLRTTLEVGVSHFRFDVMRTFGLMLQSISSQDEAHYILSQFHQDHQLQNVRDYVEIGKLPLGLTRLFASNA